MEDSGGRGDTRFSRRKKLIALAACIIATVAVAGYAAWYLDSLGFSDGSSPSLTLVQDDASTWVFTIHNPVPENMVSWDDVEIRLVATPVEEGSSFTNAYWVWRPSQELLTSNEGEETRQYVNSSYVTPSIMIACNLTDIAGNGLLNEGDHFTLILVGSNADLAGVPCVLTVKWIGYQGVMGSMEFVP